MRKNTIRIIYGPGNGKSASAVGYGLLGALAGKKVIIVQFLKGVLEERSLEILERMDLEMKVFRFERSRCYFEDLPEDQKKEETMNLRNGFNFAKKVMATGECDLLILDDLGTELTTAFVQSALYQIVSTRLMERRSTILSTNLLPDGIERRYSPQVASRIEGEYQLLAFVGEDVRKLRKQRRP